MEQYDEAYGGFAYSYDVFMDDIPYDAWAEYLHSLLTQHGVFDGILLELGCGTGNMTMRMADLGYDLIGLDLSEDMLEVARDKCSPQILFLNQDMREMELYGTVAAIYCVCDGMNYLREPEDLLQVFIKANNYLEAEGVFIFDMKTSYFFSKILGNCTIAENREDASLIWENEYHEDSMVNEYYLTIYQLEDEERGLYVRGDEHHVQRAYPVEAVKELIEQGGMEFVAVYDAFTHKSPDEQSERVYFIARERFQEGKYYGGA